MNLIDEPELTQDEQLEIRYAAMVMLEGDILPEDEIISAAKDFIIGVREPYRGKIEAIILNQTFSLTERAKTIAARYM